MDLSHIQASDEVIAEFPVTTTQERCWFLDRINPGEPALNVAVRWELRGRVSAECVERAFAHVIERHEVLRTRFAERDGAPVQQVMARAPFRLGQLDLRTSPEADRMARIDAIAHEEAARPFDLTKPGLIRANLVRFDTERSMLLIVAHQSVFDGYSIGILGREIGVATAAYQAGKTPDLPELPLQYGDFALWQQEYLNAGVLEEEGAYWRDVMKDAPYFEVQPDRPRPVQRSTDVRMMHRPLAEDFHARLTGAARAAGVTPFAYGAGVVAACLHRLTGAEEVLMGTQIAGRMDVDLEPLIGVFINNLVLRHRTDPASALSDQITAARGVVEGALAHQSMPFNRLVKMLNPLRDASRNPLISVNFNLLEVFMKGQSYGDFELISVPSHAPGSVYDLQVVAIGRPAGGWRLTVEYRPDLFAESTIENLLKLVEAGFQTAFEAPETRIGALPIEADLLTRHETVSAGLSRIEHSLQAHPMVAEVAAVTGPSGPYAFVVAQNTGTLPLETLPAALMTHLAETLSPEDTPTGVSLLAALPRLAGGAVNRTQLRAPSLAAPVARTIRADPEILSKLRAWWQEILLVEEIPPGASFFNLGGHSLLVVRLLTRIREAWEVGLDIGEVYENATLTALATLVTGRMASKSAAVAAKLPLAAEAVSTDWRIMRLRRTGGGIPLIAVNNAATALALGPWFATERPITCVRVFDSGRGLDPSGLSFEAIAAEYAATIRQSQPDGPILLYGNCVHGNLALEAARHLQADGVEIAGVVMKDTWEPGYTARLLSDPRMKRREKWHSLANRIRMVRAGTMSLGGMLSMYSVVRRSGILHLGVRLGLLDRVAKSDLEADQEAFISTVTAARDRYRPEPLDLPVLHVITRITPQGRGFSPSIGWEDVIAPERLRTVRLSEVFVHREHRVGVADLAREMEKFIGA